MLEPEEITKDWLARVRELCEQATAGPWEAFIEGRDFLGGSSLVRTGSENDIEMLGASEADYDFIACARQAVPALLAEVERLRAELERCRTSSAQGYDRKTRAAPADCRRRELGS